MRSMLGVIVLTGLMSLGCGQNKELDQFKTDLTPAIGHANSMRSLIASLKQQASTEGLDGLKSELGLLDERLEEFNDKSISESDRATYDKIIPKLKELAAMVNAGKPNKAAIDELIQEAETLAESLPKSATTDASKT